MENRELEQAIKETVEGLVEKMGFEAEIVIEKTDGEEEAGSIVCNVKTKESNFLIGQYGVNLQSLQHIARVMVRRKTNERANFILDVNLYRREKNDSIIKMAKDLARQAANEKRAVVLRPMSPYERRVVHLELSKVEEVRTESIGEGEDRRVVIKPADMV